MKNFFFLILIVCLSNCSLNSDSQYWSEDNIKNKDIEKKLINIKKKSNDIRLMSYEEYKIYIDDYTKKSKYPDITK